MNYSSHFNVTSEITASSFEENNMSVHVTSIISTSHYVGLPESYKNVESFASGCFDFSLLLILKLISALFLRKD